MRNGRVQIRRASGLGARSHGRDEGCVARHADALCCTRGAAAIEFALVVPVMLLLLLGLIEMGIVFMHQVQVETAAQAGIARAEQDGFDIPAINTAVTTSTALTAIQPIPAPTQSCGCISGTTIVAASCGSTCTGGITAGTYVTVNTRTTYTPLFGLIYTSPFTLTGKAVSRIQ
jgi:Flp pilus assembly protein TadG